MVTLSANQIKKRTKILKKCDDVDIPREASLLIKINIYWFCILCSYFSLIDNGE